MGHYVFKIKVGNDQNALEKSVDTYLYLFADPEVTIRPQQDTGYYLKEKKSTHICNVKGFPVDKASIQWTFRHVDYVQLNEWIQIVNKQLTF